VPWVPNRESLVGRLLEPTWQVAPQLERTIALLAPGARICDLGAGGRRVRPGVVTVDLVAGPDTDIVADLHALPLPERSFDLVVCTGTLNLCVDPKRVLSEAFRILSPGGLLHLETAMFQPYTPEPADYWRWTQAGVARICAEAGFVEERAGSHIGPFTALASSALALTGAVFQGRGVMKKAARATSHAMFGPLKYLDALLSEDVMSRSPFSYGLYYVGRRVT